MKHYKIIVLYTISVLIMFSCDSKTKQAMEKIQEISEVVESPDFIDNQNQLEEESDFLSRTIIEPFELLTLDLPQCDRWGDNFEKMKLDRDPEENATEDIELFDKVASEKGRQELLELYQKAYNHITEKVPTYDALINDESSEIVKKQLNFLRKNLPKMKVFMVDFKALPLVTETDKCKYTLHIAGIDSPISQLSFLTILESYMQLEKMKIVD